MFARSRTSSRLVIMSVVRSTTHNMAANCRVCWVRNKTTGVIFDMDGTLTEENAIDFQAMYDRIGLVKRGDNILAQVLEDVPLDMRQRAYDIIQDEEMLACERMKIKSDFNYCIQSLEKKNIRMAISTMNCRKAYEAFVRKAKIDPNTFDPVLDRNTLHGINKPDPRIAYHILEIWGHSPQNVWFVGDSIDDIRCGKSAGCNTCLVTASGHLHKDEHLIDCRVTSLHQFVNVLTEMHE